MKSTLLTFALAILLVSGYYIGKRYVLKPNIETGVKAAEIKSTLPDGSHFSLHELRGKYVLLDFWGSWCKPCRESNPQLVELYKEFRQVPFRNATGFEIVSYGVENNITNWKEAIKEDGLLWPYQLVSTDMFNSPGIKNYNVKQIPTKFLISPEGIIIRVDPSIDQVKNLLREYTGN